MSRRLAPNSWRSCALSGSILHGVRVTGNADRTGARVSCDKLLLPAINCGALWQLRVGRNLDGLAGWGKPLEHNTTMAGRPVGSACILRGTPLSASAFGVRRRSTLRRTIPPLGSNGSKRAKWAARYVAAALMNLAFARASGTEIAPAPCGFGVCRRSFSTVQKRTRVALKSPILAVQRSRKRPNVYQRWGQH
jgi:hypothetical protein